MGKLDDRLLDICQQCIDLGRKIAQSTKAITVNSEDEYFHKVILLYFLLRGNQTLEAVMKLCKYGYTDQALLLVRSIFEMSLTVQYIGKQPVPRARLFAEYYFISRKKSLDICRKYADKWPEILRGRSQSECDGIEKEFKRVENNYPDKLHWAGKGITLSKMADEVNGGRIYYDLLYSFFCEKSHSVVRCMKDYFEENPAGGFIIKDGSEFQYFSAAIAGGCAFLLIVQSRFCELFNLHFDTEIEELKKKLETVKENES